MKKKTIILTMLVAVITLGCSKANYQSELQYASADRVMGAAMKTSASMAYNDAAVIYEEMRAEESVESEAANLTNEERKLIKRAYVRIRVENLDEADVSITDLLKKYAAYSASTEVDENSRIYSLRVPAPQYDTFLAEMNCMGRLIRRSESTEDVTLRYYDLEGRLEMKRELLKTFQSYLTRARNIEEIMSVEARIAELQNDIEGTGVQLRHLTNRVDYATIDLNLIGPASAQQTQSETLGERIRALFGNFGNFLATVVVIIIGIVIFGIPLVLLFTLLFWLLFGKVGLLRKLWVLVKGKKQEE